MTKRSAKRKVSAIVALAIVWMSGCVDVHTPGAREACLRSDQNDRGNITAVANTSVRLGSTDDRPLKSPFSRCFLLG